MQRIATRDNSKIDLSAEVLANSLAMADLRAIAGRKLADLAGEDGFLIFPDSLGTHNPDFGKNCICTLNAASLKTYNVAGFIGGKGLRLDIHSRFAKNAAEDFFLHYMLARVARVSLFNLEHDYKPDSIFDFLPLIFPHFLKKALVQGIFRQYMCQLRNDANVKGPVDIKRHISFNYPGNFKIAYSCREYNEDNHITELIRHTIEYIARLPGGSAILNTDADTKKAVMLIRQITPSYVSGERRRIIESNHKPLSHPYFTDYRILQKLCLQILRYEKLRYIEADEDMYGLLIDAAWLWEEYLALLMREGVKKVRFEHCLKDAEPKYKLFHDRSNNCDLQQLIPDYILRDFGSGGAAGENVVADAKYIPLNRQGEYEGERATDIYYKTISYMYRFCAKKGFLLYPRNAAGNSFPNPWEYSIISERDGCNGGSFIKLGLDIPASDTFQDFAAKMRENERTFLKEIMPV